MRDSVVEVEHVMPSGQPRAVEWTANWQVEESDFGTLMVFHKHPTETATAYLSTDAQGVTEAECSLCGRKLRVEPPIPGAMAEMPA
jgi:hypothetical protein